MLAGRGWLVDNNVPRGVTLLLGDAGQDVIEVRAALGQDASDDDVIAYAASQDRTLVTHDRGCARKALDRGVPHVWLRTPETRDVDRLRAELGIVIGAIEVGVKRVTVLLSKVTLGHPPVQVPPPIDA